MHESRVLAAVATILTVACAAPRNPAGALGAAPAEANAPLPVPVAAYGRESDVDLTPLERDVVERIRGAFGERVQVSESLTRAARAVAKRAAEGGPNPLGGVRSALAGAGAFDPAPVSHLASGPPDVVGATLAARAREHELTHVGVGVVSDGSTAHAVLLTSRRSARLDPFPRALPPGSEAILQGELIALRAPRVVLTRPTGAVEEFAAEGDRRFRAKLRFVEPGRHVVEVLGSGPHGPEVVALLAVNVGEVTDAIADAELPEEDPASAADVEARIETAINALRERHGLQPVGSDPALREVARRHSQAMLDAGRVAHVLPGTGDIAARMQRARLPFERVLENVARGPSGLAAHRAAEESPAHRGAMLDPAVNAMGCGVVRGTLPSGAPIVYLTEVFVERPRPQQTAAGLADSTARIHRLLRNRLTAQNRPALARDPELDELAADAARSMVRRGTLNPPADLNEEALRLPGRTVAATQVFIGSDIGETARARHLGDARFRRLGVGVATGTSARYGAQRLWMVLVFTD